MCFHKIVITNVPSVGMQRIDMIYLGGSLRRIKKLMSSREEKAKKAEEKLRNYIQYKYGKIDLGCVSEGVSDEWIRKFYEENRKRRLLK